jgi:transglutaminase-like putative cysteine protease
MKANAWQDTSRANWIDYGLSWIGSALAVFSCGQAVNSMEVSMIGLLAVTLGMVVSYFVRAKLGHTWFAKGDGVLYCIMAWVAVITAKTINASLFPEDTFPIELSPSAWLLWMTIFGSFLCWRDGTLIFQSIPALAIFGFVGCYDTFKYVVFLFFIFLICFATLFARAHGREMQERATKSGFFGHEQALFSDPSEQAMRLREGPWRWAAGAEWALGSALIIVVLSLLGAPVVQATAKPLSGIVSVNAPRIRSNIRNITRSLPTTSPVGTGPVSLSDTPYFEVRGDVPDYLRIGTFGRWDGRQWAVSYPTSTGLYKREDGERVGPDNTDTIEKFKHPNKKPNDFMDSYRSLVMESKALIATREVLQSGNDPNFTCGRSLDPSSNSIALLSPSQYEGTLTYDKIPELTEKFGVPKILNEELTAMLRESPLQDPLRLLTLSAIKDLTNDFTKAKAIQAEVTKRIRYNIKAPATPNGRDPAEYALLESHEGYCDVFATSMVRMARIAKIPARYAIGYLPDIRNRNSVGTQMVLESDRHAWAELYFEGAGWVAFDATEGAEVVPGGGRKDNKPTDSASVLRVIGYILNGLIAVAVAAGLIIYLRIRSLPKTASMIRSELDFEYVRFVGAIWKYTGHRRLLSETTNEYVTRVGEQLGDLRDKAKEVGLMFTDKMFGPGEIGATDVEEARQSVQNFNDLLSKKQKSR